MTEYRTFRNADPPRVLKLWNDSQLGRGAARPQSVEALETSVFAQHNFDRRGFIIAVDGDEIVGFVHAGFAPQPVAGLRMTLTRGAPTTGRIIRRKATGRYIRPERSKRGQKS